LRTKAFSALRFSDRTPSCPIYLLLHVPLCTQNDIFSTLRSLYRHLLMYSRLSIALCLHYIISAIKLLSPMLKDFQRFAPWQSPPFTPHFYNIQFYTIKFIYIIISYVLPTSYSIFLPIAFYMQNDIFSTLRSLYRHLLMYSRLSIAPAAVPISPGHG
jgi:hypothetical protein